MRIPRLNIATTLLATGLLLVAGMPVQSALLAPSATAPSPPGLADYDQPQARAQAIGLPAPSIGEAPGKGDCAMAIDRHLPAACFSNSQDAADYIAGRRSQAAQAPVKVNLTGSGGIQLQSTLCLTHDPEFPCQPDGDLRVPGWTCQYADCSEGKKIWYYSTSFSIACSHSYPANDAFANYAPNYRYYYFNRNWDYAPTNPVGNCYRVVMYPGQTQQGLNARNCNYYYSDTSSAVFSCGDDQHSYNSISWHYR